MYMGREYNRAGKRTNVSVYLSNDVGAVCLSLV